MTTLFDEPETPVVDEISVEALVGEGKKYKTVEDLAKAVVFKDQHISRIETENRGMREDLQGKQRMEEYIERLSTLQAGEQPTNSDGNHSGREGGEDKTPALKLEDIETLIVKREQKKVQEANLASAISKLRETWGPNFAAQLREQARTLGVGEAFLNSVAAENPQAFYRLVGLDAQRQPDLFQAPESTVNSGGFQTRKTNDRTQSYYADLRKKNPTEYWSTKVQNQMHADAFRLQDRFFDK